MGAKELESFTDSFTKVHTSTDSMGDNGISNLRQMALTKGLILGQHFLLLCHTLRTVWVCPTV